MNYVSQKPAHFAAKRPSCAYLRTPNARPQARGGEKREWVSALQKNANSGSILPHEAMPEWRLLRNARLCLRHVRERSPRGKPHASKYPPAPRRVLRQGASYQAAGGGRAIEKRPPPKEQPYDAQVATMHTSIGDRQNQRG